MALPDFQHVTNHQELQEWEFEFQATRDQARERLLEEILDRVQAFEDKWAAHRQAAIAHATQVNRQPTPQ